MRLLHGLVGIIATCALYGCGFEAPAPLRTPAPPTPTPPLSTIAATLAIPAAQLAQLVNNTTEYSIANLHDQPLNCGFSHCRLNLTAQRTGPASISAENGVLALRLPFAIQAQLATTGIFSFLHVKGDGQGVADARTNLSITPDLDLHSSSSGMVRFDNARLRLGAITANIAQLWDDNQNLLAKPLWRTLDTRVEKLPLKAKITALWSGAFKPIRIGKSPLTWLALRPEQLSVAQPDISGGAVIISLSLSVRSQVLVENSSPPNPPTPLPTVKIMATPSDEFSFAVPVLLPYDRAARLAMASLAKNPPRIAGMTVRFDAIQILPSGDDVVVTVKFCADPGWDPFGWLASCGTVYLRGTPAFDSARQIISIRNLHYDIASANLMLTTLHALAGNLLAKRLEGHLQFDESNDVARLETDIVSALAKPQGDDITIAIHVESFGRPSFTWSATGFIAVFSAHGKVTTRLNL